ncbi:cytochrome c oxidase subunit 3 [Herminiimonas fonticola]|uniref:Cytochrome c oxidase subunit 3 n=1 Tax=Herminiimonas fonticola TaxID=303380 RepID=A0A4R6G691_9BURK|nr:cytochrome c oxidase subunit 3 [Herminiimonas fonticola]RBA24006.1 Heme/copper-type cytochrome/quinol oxidase subunit 3 [Herminiimonas fonticola]TDN90006.1 cytochrome c oxidase subunit 3 [Herminiimonas fonticola]
MNTCILLKTDNAHSSGASTAWRDLEPVALGTALWIFMGVASSLFALFIASYAMRMDANDWHPLAMPWQLWLSTLLLISGSVTLQLASRSARSADWRRTRALLLMGGIAALAFICIQLWAWQALLAAQVRPAGNPAGSFFYLLTAMHGLHVAGGLLAWGRTARRAWSAEADAASSRIAWSISLCARYWHFLLVVWLLLFATLGWLTPEVVRFICGPR